MSAEIPDPLRAQAQALCEDPRWTSLLQRHWPGFFQPTATRPLSTRIQRHDQMLLHSLKHHQDANAAVSQYFNVALQQHFAARQILDALFPPAQGRIEVLDFACGFGRLIRFLASGERDVRLAVSEIQPEALQFVTEEFGVEALPSSMQPALFDPGRRFDCIWVASLFSHLPEGLFQGWLQRLHALLTPQGVLCFSVHDEALMPPGDRMPDRGLLFKAQSENADLDAQAYGTTYVTEAYVRRAIEQAAGAGHPCQRIRKGLAHEQDIYVVPARRDRDLSALAGFRRGAWGWVDERQDDGRTLRLSGWAASLDDGAIASVSVRIDGVLHECPTGMVRTDVRDAFNDARLTGAGWSFIHTWAEPQAEHWVEVTAHTARSETALLYAGLPGGRRSAPATPEAGHVYTRYSGDIDMQQRSSLSVLASLVAPGSRVLDLGTGTGVLGRHLQRERGCQVDGLTLNAEEQAAARPAYDRLVLQDLEDTAWPRHFEDRRYECIVCADVLEHLREPERVLQACLRLLAPQGRLLVSVPNVAYAGMTVALMHGNWNYGPEGLLDRTHLRFFTRRSFEHLLQGQGWRVDRVEAIAHTWYYTEFWKPFDSLPPAVARYLLAQPDASAYQLVFSARPAQAEQAAPTLPQMPVPAPDPTINVAVFTATLYALQGGSASLAHSVHALGRIGTDSQTLHFELPAAWAGASGLRLDPADRPGTLRLQACTLRNTAGNIVWQWRAAVDGTAPLQACRRHMVELAAPASPADAQAHLAAVPFAPHVPLALLGDDPQIDLPLPAAAMRTGGPWQLDVQCGWPFSADYLALQDAATQAAARRAARPVIEVVVPVYGNLAVVQRCLGSVLAAHNRAPWHLTVIDDASPQPEVGAWLRELALAHPTVSVITNARNLGFVATANLGLRLAGRHDVLLLNSDTEVAAGWLDRLQRAAYGQDRVGTVTPFSNNATICSYPRFCEDNPLPSGHSVASLDGLFAQAQPGATLAIPTAIGFCMLIRRECLDEVGEFDVQTFGAGYGEENDFCVRASAHGWLHLHALDVFVYHAGAASFNDSRHALQQSALQAINRLHPHYDDMVRAFVQQDPARPYREAVSQRLADPGACTHRRRPT